MRDRRPWLRHSKPQRAETRIAVQSPETSPCHQLPPCDDIHLRTLWVIYVSQPDQRFSYHIHYRLDEELDYATSYTLNSSEPQSIHYYFTVKRESMIGVHRYHQHLYLRPEHRLQPPKRWLEPAPPH